MMRLLLTLLLLVCAISVGGADDAGAPHPPSFIGPTTAEGGFDFAKKPNKTRLQVSGVACAKPGVCLLAFDEGREARFATLSEPRYVAEPEPVVLRDGPKKAEVDAEAAATDGAFFYVAGSHATSRVVPDDDADPAEVAESDGVACVKRPLAKTIVRLAVDPETGKTTNAEPEQGDLVPALQAVPILKDALDVCIATGRGLDIEGLAVSPGMLWLGFRGPLKDGRALVLPVPIDAAFGGAAAPAATPIELDLDGRAIRDMQWTEGGLLILAGRGDADSRDAPGWALAFWTEKGGLGPLTPLSLPRPDRTGMAGCDDKESKPEALAITETRADAWRVVVLSDGLCDGGPIWLDVPRP